MEAFIVIVDKKEDWQPYYPTEQIVTVKDYLFDKKYQEAKDLRILNLSRNYKYLSLGYYSCLLAEARGHRIIPNLRTINDLSKKKLYLSDLDELQKITTLMASNYVKVKDNLKVISFKIYFGQTRILEFKKLGREIFQYYPVPVLEVRLILDKVWKISSIVPVSIKNLTEDEETFFAQSLEHYSNRIWRLPRKQKAYIYDLAILVNPEEHLSPSDQRALEKFKEACERRDLYTEFITKRDLYKLNEFDALFIRETTSINNHTYHFAKMASSEGLVVIDDPNSILKCTNKIFIFNLLERKGIPNIPGLFVSNANKETIKNLEEKFNYPMVVKIPDGSFSVGVKKVDKREELIFELQEMFKKSDLILIQKFLYTKYDWRIGMLGGMPLFACKYFMSKDHWQIYNHAKNEESQEFSGDFVTLELKDVPSKVLDVAKKAANSIGKGLYGVDLKEDDEGHVYVVEINDNPNIDFGIEDQVLGDKLYDLLVEWFLKEIQKKEDAQKLEEKPSIQDLGIRALD